MLAVIKYVVDDNIICMVHATQFNSYCAKLSTSFLLSYGPNRPELNSVDHEIYGVYSSVHMSFKSTELKKSSSDWLNAGKAVTQHLSEKDAIFVFPCFVR